MFWSVLLAWGQVLTLTSPQVGGKWRGASGFRAWQNLQDTPGQPSPWKAEQGW